MNPLPKHQLIEELSSRVGLDESTVRDVFRGLAQLTAEHASDGILVPYFGEFRAQRGEPVVVRNPATGENVEAPGPIEIAFTPDSKCIDTLGDAYAREEIGDRMPEMEEPPAPLSELNLVINDEDRLLAGITKETASETKLKIGGEPDWIQEPDIPSCCKHEMTFYGQFDSHLGDEYNLWDSAIIYVFVCFNCGGHTSVLQSY